MTSALDIQIVSTPNLAKIENFFKDASYRESIEFSANFNTRISIERRLRLPFLDPQTGVAQSHSQLFMDKRQRMPGFREGQIYTYPAARWRKSRRQYLTKPFRFPTRPFQVFRKEHEALVVSSNTNPSSGAGTASPIIAALGDADSMNSSGMMEESSSLGAAGGDTSDSKDSQQQQALSLKEDLPKEWFFDEIDINDVDSLEDPKSPADDEYDYDPRYGNKKRRKRRPYNRRALLTPGSETPVRRRASSNRGRGALSATTMGQASTSSAFPIGVPPGPMTLDVSDGMLPEAPTTPTSSGRRRGTGSRGRRRARNTNANACDQPHSPGMSAEPPSFESAAAAMGVDDEHGDLRSYRKYL